MTERDADGLDDARALLPGRELVAREVLADGERSTVLRVEATDRDGGHQGLIVKRYRAGGEGWRREAAALASVPGSVRVPALVAVGSSPQIVVTEDLGDGPSVATALLGDDPRAAEQAVIGWAEALAELHSATRDSREQFRAALDARAEPDELAESSLPSQLRAAERDLDRQCGSLGVNLPAGALDSLVDLATRLSGDGAAAITPADTCPDNNVTVGSRRVLIDFEGAQWRHVAWDVAYLLVPWPTCWCCWRMPEVVAARGVAAYRDAAGDRFPEVAADCFLADVEAATVAWSLTSASRYLDHALDDERAGPPAPNPDRPAPTRQALILHRLARAARSSELPALAELAQALQDVLRRRWGDIPLNYAPAFRGWPD